MVLNLITIFSVCGCGCVGGVVCVCANSQCLFHPDARMLGSLPA